MNILPFPVAIAEGSHPFPSRTRKLSPPALMVPGAQAPGRVSRRRNYFRKTLPLRQGLSHSADKLPNNCYRVLADLRVGGHDREIFAKSLGYQEPVKRIPVVRRQGVNVQGVVHLYR